MKLSLPSKMVEQLVWVPVISFCKISFLVTHLIPNYAETGRSRPPNRQILRITLSYAEISFPMGRAKNESPSTEWMDG
jgi:hypothetical protein